MVAQPFVFPLSPKSQVTVELAHGRIERRAIVSAIITEPTPDDRIEHVGLPAVFPLADYRPCSAHKSERPGRRPGRQQGGTTTVFICTCSPEESTLASNRSCSRHGTVACAAVEALGSGSWCRSCSRAT